ncbi:MAG TPA: N-acetylmuramic acid 6-phosphate etherase [Polyangia bacterium]|nr:N-acetylmuramic acid 6-phosphate etherase [Polyangia bacterium]
MAARKPPPAGPDYDALPTEAPHPKARHLDALRPIDIVDLLIHEELKVPRAVLRERRRIAQAAVRIARTLRAGGRLIYVGAGTSGRLGVLDAAECPPTFSTPPSLVVGVIAGGPRALTHAVEGAEDDGREAEARLRRLAVSPRDVVCAIAASGVTPFARAALAYARERGAHTIFVTCAPPPDARVLADQVIAPRVGPEVLAGSTRLKAGTATKIILNALTTTAMVGIGKVYGNRMVDVRPTSAKLRARAGRMVRELTGLDAAASGKLLERAGGQVKVAVVMHHLRVPAAKARALLEAAGGRLREVVGVGHHGAR